MVVVSVHTKNAYGGGGGYTAPLILNVSTTRWLVVRLLSMLLYLWRKYPCHQWTEAGWVPGPVETLLS